MAYVDDISQAFYEWERKLRGWDVYPYAVELEPPLIPIGAYLRPVKPTVDDGRQETFLSSLSDGISGLFKPKTDQKEIENAEPDFEFDDSPNYFNLPDQKFCTYKIALPTDHAGNLATYKNFLQSLRYAGNHLSFEIIGSKNETVIQFCTWKSDSNRLLDQIRAHLPDATVIEGSDSINPNIFSDQALIIDFGLENMVMSPLYCLSDLKNDQLTALVGSMDTLSDKEQCIFQILFKHCHEEWESYLYDSVTDIEGKPLFIDGHDLVANVREKTKSPLYACVIRLAVIAETDERRWELARSAGGTLAQFNAPKSNKLMPLNNEGYDNYDHWRNVIDRTTHRTGMLLSLNELVGLLHYPDEVVKSEKLVRQRLKTKAVSDIAIGHDLILGTNEHRGVSNEVSLNAEQRSRHMYIVGASGTGKSTLMLNCIRQDIESGQGICVLDPHGDLIDQALAYIPESRIEDVILLDPSDEQYPIGFNILHAHSNLEKTILASDLTAVFERLSTTWGDQMNAVLSNGILAFLESEVGGTLLDLRRFLIEKEFRFKFLETVTDPEVVYYWKNEFPLLSGRPQASVLTRLNTFLRPKPIRHMVAQKKSAIDFADIMDTGKILLCKLSHGGIGEENAYLLGALIASKLQQTALSRQAISQEKRRFFWLYIDEFQNFITPSIAQTLSGARKYHLGMILGHQELTQVAIQDRAIAASVIANPYTRICFRMGDRDARTLSEGFSSFDAQDLQSLGIGEAIGRIEQAKYDFSLTTYPLPDIDDQDVEFKVDAIREMSRARYSISLSEFKTSATESNERESEIHTPEKCVQEKPTAKIQPEKNRSDSLKGKGGKRHKEIQLLLQKTAHEISLGADIEKHIGDGNHIDLIINNRKKLIACEISVTTSAEHELDNIRKCLNGGYSNIWMITDDTEHLDNIQSTAKNFLNSNDFEIIQFYLVEDALSCIRSIKPIESSVVRGRNVNLSWENVSSNEIKRRQTTFAKSQARE